MSYFKVCPHCGAHLDPGEVCDCGAAQDNNQRFNQLLNICAHPRAMYSALAALGTCDRAALEDTAYSLIMQLPDSSIKRLMEKYEKKYAAQGATNTQDGEAEQIKPAVSASDNTTV